MLRINHIDVSYGPVKALHDVSISIGENQIISIIGANGAGKSTLMNAIVGLCKIRNGNIIFEDQEIQNSDTHEIVRKGIVLVPEGRKVFPKMTVLENLEMGAYARKENFHTDLEDIFAYFPRLFERKNQQAGTLSGGEQQMLAIGRGLMAKPKLLMLDEPSMGLAPVIVEDVFRVIGQIHKDRKLPILLVEQNAYMALEVSTHCYVLENGSMKLEGSSEELMSSDEIKSAYLGG